MITPLLVTQFEVVGWAWQQLRSPAVHVLQGIFLAVFGLKEIFWDGASKPDIKPISVNLQTQSAKIRRSCLQFFIGKQADFCAQKFYQVHGILFFSAGAATVLSALHKMDQIHLGSSLPLLQGLEASLFISACVVALRHNINQFLHAQDLATKNLALLGITSSLSYVLWGAMTLFGFSLTMAWIFCAIALSTGGLKILLESSLYKQLKKNAGNAGNA